MTTSEPLISHKDTERTAGADRLAARSPLRSAARAALFQGPRIYNLFPRLIGPVSAWRTHLPRIAAMGFDWVYINSFHEPGRTGSLYAVKDPYRLNPLFRGDASATDDALLSDFAALARQHGLRVMTDLSIAYVARDSQLAGERTDWFRRGLDGMLLSPRTSDPADPHRVAVWEDLAAFDYDLPAAREALIDFWGRYIRHYQGLGIDGFIGKSAYMVPAAVWRALFDGVRGGARPLTFIAETLGARIEQSEALAPAKFDYFLNNAKWWDFKAEWLLEQQTRLSRIAPTISFPESHDTGRLAASVPDEDPARLEHSLKFHALFSAVFSSGWMMPVGYEYGFTQRLDVIETSPDDWETPRVDLSKFIAAVNAMKADTPALNIEAEPRRISPPGSSVLALMRSNGWSPAAGNNCAVIVLNSDELATHPVDPGVLLADTGGRYDRVTDVTPFRTAAALAPGPSLLLEPLELRVFRGEVLERRPVTRAKAASERTLRELARSRVAIEAVRPEIDGGRFPIKRVVGDTLEVTADIFAEGHDKIAACVKYKERGAREWREAPMGFVDNDRWAGYVPLARNMTYVYTVEAWRDRFETWRAEFIKKRDAGQDVKLELQEGLELVKWTLAAAEGSARESLQAVVSRTELTPEETELARLLVAEDLRQLMAVHGEREEVSRYEHELLVVVDRLAARYSAWYELFPRSQTADVSRHGTFTDVIERLPYVRDMGFDVLYFPPIHPIGRTKRKGRNNSLTAGPDDPGSPYAIGGEAGGHDAVHPDLGTLDDFRRLVRAAQEHGLELALDFAVQCSLDHPWIKEHPDWFDWRADGSIKYAENPPKKYEDIVNPNFYRALPDLWFALRDVILFWCGQGVRIFRVDNPHTKPLPFWEWMIGEVRDRYPDVIFLSEAFTRPKLMRRLAKAGFSQSYTYFTWRNTKHELIEYLNELSQSESQDYLRPNFFANTPDINPFFLQTGGRPAFMIRVALAALLSGAYGIYSGYEVCEAAALPGREEYLDAEKYEIKLRDWNQAGNIRGYITELNRIRRDNPALHDFRNLRFYNSDDDHMLVFGKMTPLRDNVILAAINLDPRQTRTTRFEVPLWELGLPDNGMVHVDDLFGRRRFSWQGKHQWVTLDPHANPAAVWRISAPVQDQFVRRHDRAYRPNVPGVAA